MTSSFVTGVAIGLLFSISAAASFIYGERIMDGVTNKISNIISKITE